jgi:hypothetical protein
MNPLRQVNVVRYVAPLREGGSLPGIIEADDGFLYALKFRGAGQGTKALVADYIGAELARELGLKVPELVLADLGEGFGRTEPDEEIQDLLKFSVGQNLGLHYLSGSISFDPLVHEVEPELAAKIVWLDAFLMNIDRTAKNTNMLFWNKELWLIDHGASLYFHHAPENWEDQAQRPFAAIKEHVLISKASSIVEMSEMLTPIITPQLLEMLVDGIPDSFINEQDGVNKELYKSFLLKRLESMSTFVTEAENARNARL